MSMWKRQKRLLSVLLRGLLATEGVISEACLATPRRAAQEAGSPMNRAVEACNY
jgi:hypothetical protein